MRAAGRVHGKGDECFLQHRMALNATHLRQPVQAQVFAEPRKHDEDGPVWLLDGDELITIERDDTLLKHIGHSASC